MTPADQVTEGLRAHRVVAIVLQLAWRLPLMVAGVVMIRVAPAGWACIFDIAAGVAMIRWSALSQSGEA